MNGSRRLYKAWSKKEIPARAHPLLPRQAIALAGHFTFILNRPQAAVRILLGFHCVLRTIEMLHCQRKDIVVAGTGDAAVISFESKTGNRFGFVEARTITDVRIVRFLCAVMGGMSPRETPRR